MMRLKLPSAVVWLAFAALFVVILPRDRTPRPADGQALQTLARQNIEQRLQTDPACTVQAVDVVSISACPGNDWAWHVSGIARYELGGTPTERWFMIVVLDNRRGETALGSHFWGRECLVPEDRP